ncbi:hypothetical protein [Nocardioides sp. AX2bis]|uniref:hypothetical protein n=1 Tax=Nocardioides sp. AX2bis TaxID=2653157 RepID=UPI0012F15CB6|nr:hypothetical protein [Nocardioides sp. AX2bis]VXC52827.1 hypothetical protein NOCARDAX2BIS_80033 [Nocardioides sp. AX2bis]
MIVGWQVSTLLSTDLAVNVLEVRFWSCQRTGQDVTRLIQHSDRGMRDGHNESSKHSVMEALS